MHVPPHFQLTVRRFDVWRWLLVGAVSAAAIAWAAWAVLAPAQPQSVVAGSGIVLLICATATARWLVRQQVLHLQWDTQAWHLASASGRHAPVRGRLEVAVDAGAWMLLRFFPDGRPRFRGVVWLPLQRLGLEACWHSLRLTLHGAQVVAEPLAGHP